MLCARDSHEVRYHLQALHDARGSDSSPALVHEVSPILAPDSTTHTGYDYSEEVGYRSSCLELLGAVRQDLSQNELLHNSFPFAFPGHTSPTTL